MHTDPSQNDPSPYDPAPSTGPAGDIPAHPGRAPESPPAIPLDVHEGPDASEDEGPLEISLGEMPPVAPEPLELGNLPQEGSEPPAPFPARPAAAAGSPAGMGRPESPPASGQPTRRVEELGSIPARVQAGGAPEEPTASSAPPPTGQAAPSPQANATPGAESGAPGTFAPEGSVHDPDPDPAAGPDEGSEAPEGHEDSFAGIAEGIDFDSIQKNLGSEDGAKDEEVEFETGCADGDGNPQRAEVSTLSPRHQLESWLGTMVQKNASDLILRAGGRPSIRIDGHIRFLEGRVPTSGALQEVLEGIIGKARMDTWGHEGSVDSAVHLDGLGRFRLNAYKQMGEPALVLRRIGEDPPLLESLGLPIQQLKRLASKKRGLILVTGIAGSGKSTTLAAMIQYMNLHLERHVITLEDPVETLFTEDRCVISQREVGTDCPNFSEGLRHALRQSPDVILIGEMRDAETVTAALDATETGHLVMSTLHTVNAPQTVDRILSFYPSEQHVQARSRLSDNLVGVLSQRLLPRSSGRGMIAACELLASTPHVRELLAEGNITELARVIEGGSEPGLLSFNQSLTALVERTAVDLDVALAASDRPDELMLNLRGFRHGGKKEAKSEPDAAASSLRMKPAE